jgi:trehalose 6-phosphate synthase
MPRVTAEPTQLIVLSNREPYRHERDAAGALIAVRCASGVVNAVEPLIRDSCGVWIAEGAGAPDRESACVRDGVDVPPEAPRYRLRRIFLSPEERQGYYHGFSNGALWPLCHRTSVQPVYFARDFHGYEAVNRRFAEAVAEEAAEPAPIVLVQDYHFALAPELIRRQLPQSRIATFWHIPWPRPETFATCPWSRVLLDGLLGSSAVAFQTAADAQNFLSTVDQLSVARVDRVDGVVRHQGRPIAVTVHPVSVEWPGPVAAAPSIAECRASVRDELGLPQGIALGVGVDRLDYTKGLEQKFLAVERLLESRPELVGRFVFAQLAEPTRDSVPIYRATRARVRDTAARINERFAVGGGAIRLFEGHHRPEQVMRYLRAADLCFVGSLHDGLNLVSKEFVRARDDERGVLVLSQYAGAAHELADALIVNPHDRDRVADALAEALTMAPLEQRARMRRMRQHVAGANAAHWARAVLADIAVPPVTPVPWHAKLGELPVLVSPRPLAASDASVS